MIVNNIIDASSVHDSIFKIVRPQELVFVCKLDILDSRPALRLALLVDYSRSPVAPRSKNIVVVLKGLRPDYLFRMVGNELANLFWGLALARGTFRSPEEDEDCALRYVVQPSRDRSNFEGFLEDRRDGGSLDSAFFRSREGAVVVEVAVEESRRWVEDGRRVLSEAEKMLVRVEVGKDGWERWVE